ncbi:DNA-binding response OmpR family regulator [Cohnella sp. SGD-V74]|jgi:Response regulators consisting of a CheY-like receiver domain and a winged-helix DNA-binding domain|nr:DNA-binding response OmpR family regulator [Cohnella sp. SGD-V74]
MNDARWMAADTPEQFRTERTRGILYIEDNREIGQWVKEELEQRGYAVQWLTSGEGAEREVLEKDVVILDIMLPGLDGFTIGQRLKRAAPSVPILLLSARSAVDDKLAGLKFADDYVTKPFHIDELAARVEVLLRRNGSGIPKRLKLGQHIVVNMTENTVLNESTGEEIILTGKQHQILMYFLSRPNQILPKEHIFEAIWGEPYMEGDKTLMVHIRHLRKKLERNPDAPEIVETVRGIGYRVRL